MEQMRASEGINSVIRSIEILKSLSRGAGRISDLSTQLRLGKSTVHRLLKSLEVSGMVTRDPINRSYYLAPLLFELASRPIVSHHHLIFSAHDEMRRLRDLTRETVALHIRIGLERICIEELESPESLKYTSGKGFVAPIYTSSIGKILLSEIENKELQRLFKTLRLMPMSPNTITDKKGLWKALQEVKKQGYATSFGERIEGAAALSVAIKNYSCPAALSVWGPDHRFTLDVMMKFLNDLRDCARRISDRLAERSK